MKHRKGCQLTPRLLMSCKNHSVLERDRCRAKRYPARGSASSTCDSTMPTANLAHDSRPRGTARRIESPNGDEAGILVPHNFGGPTIRLSVPTVNEILKRIDERWRDGNPFSASRQSPRYVVPMMIQLPPEPRDARNLLRDWIAQGLRQRILRHACQGAGPEGGPMAQLSRLATLRRLRGSTSKSLKLLAVL